MLVKNYTRKYVQLTKGLQLNIFSCIVFNKHPQQKLLIPIGCLTPFSFSLSNQRREQYMSEKTTVNLPAKYSITMTHMLSVADVATILGVCRQTVYTYIYTEGLPSITVGRIRRIHPDSLNKWVLEKEKT